MSVYTGNLIEDYTPVVKYGGGIRTNLDVSVGDGATVTLPSTTTIGGSAVVALGDITSSSTSASAFTVTNTGVFVGAKVVGVTANSATSGTIVLETANGLTTGHLHTLTSSGTITTTGDMLSVVANSATTSTGLVRVSGTGLTDGFALAVTSGGANTTATGGAVNISVGAATAGTGITITGTGVYAGAGLFRIVNNTSTTGTQASISSTGMTSGKGLLITAAAATLTTGRYISCNDGVSEVFGIGADGHIHTVQGTAPTIVVTSQAGITAAAITAGSSDVCGTITTTGTSTGATILDITFNKTYTTAPKAVIIAPANAAASMPNTSYFVSAISATTFTITVAAGGTYAATPSWRYVVIA